MANNFLAKPVTILLCLQCAKYTARPSFQQILYPRSGTSSFRIWWPKLRSPQFSPSFHPYIAVLGGFQCITAEPLVH